MIKPLTAKQALFVSEFLKDLNATQAAIRCGYSVKSATKQGSRLSTNADVSRAIASAQAERLASNELTASRLLEEYRRVAFTDTRTFFDAQGNLKPIKDLTAEQGAVLSSVEVIQRNLTSGDGVLDTVHKIKFWDKTKAMQDLAKHFQLLTERVEHLGAIDFGWKQDAD